MANLDANIINLWEEEDDEFLLEESLSTDTDKVDVDALVNDYLKEQEKINNGKQKKVEEQIEQTEQNRRDAFTEKKQVFNLEKMQRALEPSVQTLSAYGTDNNGVITKDSIMEAKKRLNLRHVQNLKNREHFDIDGIKDIGGFEDILLFGTMDCYRESSSTGLLLDGSKLSTEGRHKLVSGICRLHITIEGRVTGGDISTGFLKRKEIGLTPKIREDARLKDFIGIEKIREQEKNTHYFEIAYVDCDLLFDTGGGDRTLSEMYKVIGTYTNDDEEMLLDLAALDLVKKYKASYVDACCMAISRLYVNPNFRHLGLSCWLLRNLPALGQTVVNKPIGDMLLVPGDFSGEALRRNQTRKAYTDWLKDYYIKNGFKLDTELGTHGVYRYKRINL